MTCENLIPDLSSSWKWLRLGRPKGPCSPFLLPMVSPPKLTKVVIRWTRRLRIKMSRHLMVMWIWRDAMMLRERTSFLYCIIWGVASTCLKSETLRMMLSNSQVEHKLRENISVIIGREDTALWKQIIHGQGDKHVKTVTLIAACTRHHQDPHLHHYLAVNNVRDVLVNENHDGQRNSLPNLRVSSNQIKLWSIMCT